MKLGAAGAVLLLAGCLPDFPDAGTCIRNCNVAGVACLRASDACVDECGEDEMCARECGDILVSCMEQLFGCVADCVEGVERSLD